MPRRLVRVAAALVFSAFSLSAPFARAEALSPIVKGPYLQDVSPTGAEIRVEVNPPAPVTLEILPANQPLAERSKQTVTDAQATAFHVLRVTKLLPKTHYTYRVKVSGAQQVGELTTAPPPGSSESFQFLIYGDDRTDVASHAAVVHAMTSAPGDFLINTGDYVQSGGDPDDWQSFFDVETPLLRDRCLYAAVGNHELMDAQATLFLRYLAPTADSKGDGEKPKLYGSYRWANTRFFLLNAMDSFDSGEERAWLEDELARADKEDGLTWRVVVLHHSPWSSGPHGDNRRMLGAGIPAVLAKHSVDLILAGHDHIYERGYNAKLRYVISGGGGAPLYPIEAQESSSRKVASVHHYIEASVTTGAIQLVAKRDDGSVVDRCSFTKSSPGWDCDPPPAPLAITPPHVDSNEVAPTPHASRCGCRVPGAHASSPAAGAWSLALIAIAALRRRRYSRR